MKRPSIAAAVATLDKPESLRRCLDGLLAGHVLPDEILIVDQSRDSTANEAVLAALPDEGARIVLVRQTPRGLSRSRNAAFEAASTDVVAVTDDDCVPDANWIAELRQAFAADDPPTAVCGRVLPLGAPERDRHAVSSRTSEVRREFSGPALPWVVGTGANFAARPEAVRAIGGYDERLGVGSPGGAGEDLDILRRLLGAGARILYEPRCVVHHERQTPDRRRATRWRYGHGAGACCALWLRERQAFALRAVAAWFAMRARLLARAITARDAQAIDGELRVLGGTCAGLVYGFRVR